MTLGVLIDVFTPACSHSRDESQEVSCTAHRLLAAPARSRWTRLESCLPWEHVDREVFVRCEGSFGIAIGSCHLMSSDILQASIFALRSNDDISPRGVRLNVCYTMLVYSRHAEEAVSAMAT